MILVTGISGFIGKHLLSALVKKYGYENVVAFSSIYIENCKCILHNNYQFNPDLFIKEGYERIDTIIHLGAYTPKKGSQANDWISCNLNIINTGKLLGLKLPNLKNFIFASTLDIYASENKIIDENSKVEPVSLYGYSKLYCEHMIKSWANENKLSYKILRIGHVYGPGEEKYKKIIPVAFERILKNQSIQIFGEGTEMRTFIYVEDLVLAIIKAISLEKNEIINLVGGKSLSIKDLINKIISITGVKRKIEYIPFKGEVRNLLFDNSRMKKLLLDEERSLDEGLLAEYNYLKKLE